MRASPRSWTTRDVPSDDRRTEERGSWLLLGLVALLVVLTFGSFRVLFPLAYNFGERTTFTFAGLIAVALFAVPVITPLVRRVLGSRGSLTAVVTALGVARLAVPLVRPVPLWLGAAAGVLGLVALTLVYTGSRADRARGGRWFAHGLVLGLALDVATLAPFLTWEPAWQNGPLARFVSVVLVAAAIFVAWRAPLPDGEPRAGAWVTGAIGPFLMLHLLFLQNAAFVGSIVDSHLPMAVALVLAGDILALLAMGWSGPSSRVGRLGIGVALVVLAALIHEVTGPLAAAVLLAAHAAAAVALSSALAREGRPGSWRPGVGMTLASVGFLLLTMLFYLHYDAPLPFPNVALAPIAAALLSVAMVGGASQAGPRAGPGRRLAVVPAVLLVVPLLIAITSRTPEPRAAVRTSVRLVNYNVHTTLDVRGQLDPEAVAGVIAAQRPDVVILQEVSRGWAVAGTIDSAEWLSSRLGLPYVYVSAADAGFGNAIFSRFPIVRTDEGLLPKAAGPMDRAWVRAVLDTGEQTLTVVGTHLHHEHDGPEDERTRLEQIGTLLGVWGGASRTVIAGDMNAEPSSDEFARFEAAGLHTAGDLSEPTYPSTNPTDRIDYIFATPDLAFSDVEIPAGTASDHLAVAATVKLARR